MKDHRRPAGPGPDAAGGNGRRFGSEEPDVGHPLRLARRQLERREWTQALASLRRLVATSDSYRDWGAAVPLLDLLPVESLLHGVRVALLGTYTVTHLGAMLRLAGLRAGLDIQVYEAPYAQHEQQILDRHSGLYRFDPEFVVIATHAGDLALPLIDDDGAAVAAELARWRAMWDRICERSRAAVVQHNFAVPPERPFGHFTARVPHSRANSIHAVNVQLADAADERVSLVDCDWLSSVFGKARWFDDRYWYLAKYAVAPAALPLLSRHTEAVLGARLGRARKCLVVDLDNTLWGGVVGEEGPTGIRLAGAVGEAHLDLQDYIRDLSRRGVIVAVSSKNDDADAREVFERHPDMRLRLDDVALFVANWRPKVENLRLIADQLGIGLDGMVFLDDDPAEREAVRVALPEVEVLDLPLDPAGFRRALADSLAFEPATLTAEDSDRTRQYRARAEARELAKAATSLDDFYRSLRMTATVTAVDDPRLARVVQLLAKTNQFNLTTRRHDAAAVQEMMRDPAYLVLSLELRDRFVDHGLVGVLIARQEGRALEIDTWLLSCRVIGRTLDAEMLMHLSRAAVSRGCRLLRGTYVPTAKNAVVRDLFERFGFRLGSRTADGTTTWEYDIAAQGPIQNEFCENGVPV